jgi:hypothetical protein
MTIVANTVVKYVLHSVDLYSEAPWENKAVFMLYTELVIGLVKVISLEQGCGSGLIEYGSGSRIFAQSGSSSGSGSKLKQNLRRQFLSQIFLKSKFESNQIKNIVIHLNFFQKVVSGIPFQW